MKSGLALLRPLGRRPLKSVVCPERRSASRGRGPGRGLPPESRKAWLKAIGFGSEKAYERNRKLVAVEEWEPGLPGRYRIMPTRHVARQQGYDFIEELDVSADTDEMLGRAILTAMAQSTHEDIG